LSDAASVDGTVALNHFQDGAGTGEAVSALEAERLVKSVERVRDLGEVFTPAATV